MNFVWRDYSPKTMGYVENWLDEDAINYTGLDEGFRAFYDYWANEEGYIAGENFWAKVVCENDEPFAIIAFCQHEGKVIIMEFVVDPGKRGRGRGSKLLKELLACEEVVGFPIHKGEAVIFPGNIASQKVFENAGFQYHHTHEDGNSVKYIYESSSNNSMGKK